MSAQYLALDSFWVDKKRYDDAETSYYERMAHVTLTPLADEIEKARLRLIEIRGNVENEIKSAQKELSTVPLPPQLVKPPVAEKQNEKPQEKQNKKKNKQEVKPIVKNEPVQSDIKAVRESTAAEITQSPACTASDDGGTVKFLERKVLEFNKILTSIQSQLSAFNMRLDMIEKKTSAMAGQQPKTCEKASAPPAIADDDDDVDLFGSESEDDEAAAKIKEERLAAYNAKKSKKPALIAKSSIILDVKPWDDETDMKMLEGEVRKIVMDGLLWGASKLVPLAYGIHKLQITCVVEDDKVSVDLLTETIEAIDDYVQSVDIAAFNKI